MKRGDKKYNENVVLIYFKRLHAQKCLAYIPEMCKTFIGLLLL